MKYEPSATDAEGYADAAAQDAFCAGTLWFIKQYRCDPREIDVKAQGQCPGRDCSSRSDCPSQQSRARRGEPVLANFGQLKFMAAIRCSSYLQGEFFTVNSVDSEFEMLY